VRWFHQALRADSTFSRGKAVRGFFNLGVITTVLPSLNPIQLFSGAGLFGLGVGLWTALYSMDKCVFELQLP
jgi:hypothetical protein